MNPIYEGIKINTGLDLFAKPFPLKELDDVYYGLSADAEDEALLCETASLHEIDVEYNPGDEMVLEAVTVRRFSQTKRRMAALVRALNKNFDGGITADVAQIGKVKKAGLFASVTVQIPLSDGQVISIVFHSPEEDNKRIAPDDEIIAFRWLLNKRDITQAVSPEQGREVSLEQISKRITQIAAKNSERFQKRQKQVGEQKAALRTANADLEIAKQARDDLLMEITAQEENAEDFGLSIENIRRQLDDAIALNERLQMEIDRLRAAAEKARQDEENANMDALKKEAAAHGITPENIQLLADQGVEPLRKTVRDLQLRKKNNEAAEEVARLQRLGTEKVPGVRLGGAEETGKMWEMLQNGDISQIEWDAYVERLYAEGRANRPKPEPERDTLDVRIQKKFKSRSNASLKRSLETKKGNIDDETVEFTRRMKEKGKAWKFDETGGKMKVVTFDDGQEPVGPEPDTNTEEGTSSEEPAAVQTLNNIINGDLDDDPDAIDKALDLAADELEEAGLIDQYDELLNEAADHYTVVLEQLKEAA